MPRFPKLVIEFHYNDGDVGAHPATPEEARLWTGFSETARHRPTHVLLRPDTKTGQSVSNRLQHTAAVTQALQAMYKAYGRLHDGLSDMIEGGRLTEADIPNDYHWLVKQLAGSTALANEQAGVAISSITSSTSPRTKSP